MLVIKSLRVYTHNEIELILGYALDPLWVHGEIFRLRTFEYRLPISSILLQEFCLFAAYTFPSAVSI